MAKRTPAASRRKCSKNAMSTRLRLVDVVDLVDLVEPVDRVGLGEPGAIGGASAKLELRFIDVQRLDAMVKRGWWNSELRRSP
jgi:hypothetical protein